MERKRIFPNFEDFPASLHPLLESAEIYDSSCSPEARVYFIDLGNGGIGDRHVDLYWGVWTLAFNLKTNAYADRFLDAYGRDKVEEEMFRVVAAFEVFE